MDISKKFTWLLYRNPQIIDPEFWAKIIMNFIAKDIAFVALPLLVISLIKYFHNAFNIEELLISPDYAFAIVVLFAVILSQFIELKVRAQRDHSYKLYDGTKFYTVLLVLACIHLSITVLREVSYLQLKNDKGVFLVIATLFTKIGIGCILLKTIFENTIEYKDEKHIYNSKIDILKGLHNKLIGAKDDLVSIEEITSKYLDFPKELEDESEEAQDNSFRLEELQTSLEHIRSLTSRIETKIKRIKNTVTNHVV